MNPAKPIVATHNVETETKRTHKHKIELTVTDILTALGIPESEHPGVVVNYFMPRTARDVRTPAPFAQLYVNGKLEIEWEEIEKRRDGG